MIVHGNSIKKSAQDDLLVDLKLAVHSGLVVKGIKETLRVIKSQKAKKVYLAKGGLGEKYSKVIKEFCDLYLNQTPIEIDDWLNLRDIVMKDTPSELLKEKAKKNGKDPKIGPKCYCAAIVTYSEYTILPSKEEKKQ